ncbi:MAG: PQQ-binding-like beta-propeller repeat protein, partial [candidate division KSB1 bacterium]|nr:PQQ-binding-like beta-propeller repeat protein [candidate division KSB1 bacterium]
GSEIAIAPDGTLYLVDRSLGLYAMRVDGAVLWRATTEGGIWFPAGALSPDGATLYCYSFTPGSRAQLAALCAYSTDGTLQWKFRLPDKLWVSSGPVIGCNGCIYFGSGDGAEEASFWAITPGGQLLWRVPAFASGSEEATIAPDGRVIFYGDWDIICADHRGRLLWKYRLAGEPVLAAPLCDAEGVVYVFGHRVLAIDEAGCLLWEVSLPGSFTRIAGPAIGADGTLYVGTFGNPSVLVAIE